MGSKAFQGNVEDMMFSHRDQGPRFLIVDDAPEDRAGIIRILQKGFPGARCVEVSRKRDLATALAHEAFDLVITESRLQGINALKLLRTMKSLSPHTPVVWVSHHIDEEGLVAGIKSGLSDVVSKKHLHRLATVVYENLEKARPTLEHEQTIQRLTAAEERYRTIAELTADYAYALRVEPDGTLIYEWVSDTFTRLTGYTLEDVVSGRGWTSFIHPDDLPLAVQRRDRWFAGHSDVSEFRILTRDSEERWLRDHGRPAHSEAEGRVVRIYGAGHDITQRKHLEDPLRQAQKMEAVGRLAGGMAHDFNNLLQVIAGYSDVLLRRLPHRSRLRGYVHEINNVANQGAMLTRQLMAISRRQLLQPQVLDLSGIISNMVPMLQRLLGEDIELVTRMDAALGRIKADAGQLEQVILNLAVNARDAMPQGGRLILEATNVDLDQAAATQWVGVAPGPYIRLTVSDTGCGMDAATQLHIFEPFFTTKEPGKGTGLGLFTAYGIISQNGGHITVDSAPGLGAKFTLYLPRVETSSAEAKPERSPTTSAHTGETILLVEDEAVVRDLVRQILEDIGYMVLEAANGEEALQLCRQHHGCLHLLLADIVLPGISGPEVAKHLAPAHPELQILYMSGYAQDTLAHYGALEGHSLYLQKPFTAEGLASIVRELLDRPVQGCAPETVR
jgi:two-component system, cell cycle sensor histidine kinase and response regulator CckA